MIKVRTPFLALIASLSAIAGASNATTARAESGATKFDPAKHGFRFQNTFQTGIVADAKADGLCAGMVYGALDYFNAGVTTPAQDFLPPPGSPLQKHLMDRHLKSFTSHADKWAELHLNPLGARNDEFFRWGLDGRRGGRLQELRAHIDRGAPVPLGLKSLSANPFTDHVVLAIGYDVGAYKGDLGDRKEDVKILIYDPNVPGQTRTLTPDVGNSRWCVSGGGCWRSYFVQKNYRAETPPVLASAPSHLRLEISTGGDDLRGGNDNASVLVELTDGRRITAANVNKSAKWPDRSTQTVTIDLPPGTTVDGLRLITLRTQFGGGFGGDNWNVDGVTVKMPDGEGMKTTCSLRGAPLMRFTGQRHEFQFRPRC